MNYHAGFAMHEIDLTQVNPDIKRSTGCNVVLAAAELWTHTSPVAVVNLRSTRHAARMMNQAALLSSS